MFAVEGCGLGFGEGGAAVVALVELVAGSAFSSFGDVLFFFPQVVFASGVLAGDGHGLRGLAIGVIVNNDYINSSKLGQYPIIIILFLSPSQLDARPALIYTPSPLVLHFNAFQSQFLTDTISIQLFRP